MKRTVLFAAAALLSLGISAKTPKVQPSSINADDSRITFIGRTLTENGAVSFDWSGVQAAVRFNGTSLKMKVGEDSKGYMNVYVDKQPVAAFDAVIKIDGAEEITLVENLKKGEHEVYVQKRTEGSQGTIKIESFTTDGTFLQATGRKARQIEVIGDSYTCGYGTENSTSADPFRPEDENCNLTYAAIAGRLFDADVTFICHSGQGVVRNYNSGDPDNNMVKRYLQTFDGRNDCPWDAAKGGFTPDIVIIYLGTNDFSRSLQPSMESWCDGYRKLLQEVRANYGEEVPILCVASMVNESMDEYVEEAVRRSGVKNVTAAAVFKDAHNTKGDLGASWHPNYKGHRKVASIMVPYIATLTGWDLPFKPIE